MNNLNHYQQVQKLFTEHFKHRSDIICGIEIGTKCADVTLAILRVMPNCQIYTIDPYRHVDGAEFEAGEPQEYHDLNREAAEERLVLPEFKDRVVPLIMTSEEAYHWIREHNPGKKFDFVWIDGDHSEAGITTDLDLYTGMVREGGILGGHDFGQVPAVTDVVRKRFDKCLNSGNDYTWWVFI